MRELAVGMTTRRALLPPASSRNRARTLSGMSPPPITINVPAVLRNRDDGEDAGGSAALATGTIASRNGVSRITRTARGVAWEQDEVTIVETGGGMRVTGTSQ